MIECTGGDPSVGGLRRRTHVHSLPHAARDGLPGDHRRLSLRKETPSRGAVLSPHMLHDEGGDGRAVLRARATSADAGRDRELGRTRGAGENDFTFSLCL